MPCDCPAIECLPVAPTILQCGDDIVTTLVANQTGIWLMKYEFNGVWFGRDIPVTNAQLITLPNVFNEHYIHRIQFFNNSGSLFNDTCYSLDTASIPTEATNSPVQPSGNTGQFLTIEVEADGTEVTVPGGQEIWLIYMGNQVWMRDVDFTQSGTIITIINGSTVTEGQTLLMMYL